MSTEHETAPETLVHSLIANSDIQQVLNAKNLTSLEAIATLKTPEGRKALRAQRLLSRLQSRLIAQRFSPYAVHQLCSLLQDEKPEVRLKGALSILDLAGNKEAPTKAKTEKKEPDHAAIESSEVTEILKAVAEAMDREK